MFELIAYLFGLCVIVASLNRIGNELENVGRQLERIGDDIEAME